MKTGIGSHTKPYRGITDHWLTPPNILNKLGTFDLDPCAAPEPRPWPTAKNHFTSNGIECEWSGRVWLNPPYGPETKLWLHRLAAHRNGVALVFARTETKMFFSFVWGVATAILFLRGRPKFYRPDGSIASGNCGGPVALIAYGDQNAESLHKSGISGCFLTLR